MKRINLAIFILLLAFSSHAQNEVNPLNSTPYIEVTGEGEMEVVPDEIYLHFTLKERYDGKKKVNIEDQEKKLKQYLKVNHFDLSKLSLANADEDYVVIKRKKKDVLASKDYLLEVSSTQELADVWEILDEIDASNAYIQKVDHSNMDALKKQVKIKAIKNAQEKASYLLNAVGQKVGKPLFIQERQNFVQPYARVKTMALQTDVKSDVAPAPENAMSFKKIKLNYKVFARFAIE